MINQFMHNVQIASLVSSTIAVLLILFRKIIIKNIGATWNYHIWFTIFIPFMNGKFNPNTYQLSAEKIDHTS